MLRRSLVPFLMASTFLGLVAGETPKADASKPEAPKAETAKAATPPPDPSALKPFADVIKDATEIKGLFPLWQKADKVWMEISPDQLEKPFFFSINIVQNIGERGLYAGMMGDSHIAYFKRVNNNLQLLARNTAFLAKDGTAIKRAVAEGFSDSLLSNAMVHSQPHPERKTFLVEANALLMRDLPMGAIQLEAAFRQPYGFDPFNSSFQELQGTPELTALRVNAHYSLAKLIIPGPSMPGMPPMPYTPLPENLEDVRSLFMGYYYNFSKLPETPMTPRLADDRVGHFVSTHWDWTTDSKQDPRIRLVNRWKLEKADPTAALSKPKEPIVYWLDRNIPERYRDTVRDGILEWNKAFEKIGFKDAIEVRQQPEDAKWSTHDARHASVRWFLGTDAGFAIGPSDVDPRTGEILDADIAVSDAFTRGGREEYHEEVPPVIRPTGRNRPHACTYMADSAMEAGFALDLLESREDFEPGSPAEEAFIKSYLKDVVMHEVGHTLGLRHNFRASTTYSPQQLCDPAFTATHGITGSVMDYTPTNIAPKGMKQANFHMPTLGAYDYWAIEYAYKPVDPEHEKEELGKIAAKGQSDPVLAYGTDEEAGGWGEQGMDPEVNRWDLGSDPLHYLNTRMQLSHELLDRLQERQFKPGDDFLKLRRGVNLALNRIGSASSNSAKYLGGVVYVRDHAGSNRAPLAPVSATQQREALKLIEGSIFDMNAFRFKPEFVSRLTVNQFDRGIAPDFSLTTRLLHIQAGVLDDLMQPVIMRRILDAPDKLSDPRKAFRLSELFEGVQNAIWAELKAGKEPSSLRRSLQKEHLRRMVGLVLRADSSTPDDARALAREGLRSLQASLKASSAKPAFSKESRAHFAECIATIDETMKASVQRYSF